MSVYSVILFLHLFSLLAATAASALVHFGIGRLRQAQERRPALEALSLARAADRAFPLASVGLFLTGAYMAQDVWGWSRAWVVLGIIGLGAIAVIGAAILGRRSQALAKALLAVDEGPLTGELIGRLRDPAFLTISNVPTGLAFGVVFLMVTKPGYAGGILELAVAIAIAVGIAAPAWRPAAKLVEEFGPGSAAG